METVYSQKFKETVNSTPAVAARHNSRYVMPEHLLLALISDKESEAADLATRVMWLWPMCRSATLPAVLSN